MVYPVVVVEKGSDSIPINFLVFLWLVKPFSANNHSFRSSIRPTVATFPPTTTPTPS